MLLGNRDVFPGRASQLVTSHATSPPVTRHHHTHSCTHARGHTYCTLECTHAAMVVVNTLRSRLPNQPLAVSLCWTMVFVNS